MEFKLGEEVKVSNNTFILLIKWHEQFICYGNRDVSPSYYYIQSPQRQVYKTGRKANIKEISRLIKFFLTKDIKLIEEMQNIDELNSFIRKCLPYPDYESFFKIGSFI